PRRPPRSSPASSARGRGGRPGPVHGPPPSPCARKARSRPNGASSACPDLPRSARRRLGRLHRRALGEGVVPAAERWARLAPAHLAEAEVEIAERAADRDLAHVQLVVEKPGLALER